uniref:Ig-like domain-containing protein n=2 Tax=Pyxicephalus adspersus TaxID=30357 RepID=A0AAV3A4V4_PYXAD|nr:TPA: hypothetical protein GDO54_013589 [Pyxicephalus adspersus]
MSQTLTQSSAEMKKPGETVKMTCVGSGFQIANHYISWVQQVPGGGLTWVGEIDPANGATEYSSSFKGRFTITSDKSQNTAYLQINNVKVEDTATYYCARDTVIQGWNLSYKNIQLQVFPCTSWLQNILTDSISIKNTESRAVLLLLSV